MKTFEVSHKLKNKTVSVLKYTNTKLHTGMVFEITGDTKLNGMYIVTGQKKVNCINCPFSGPSEYMTGAITCGLLKPSKGGNNYRFCTKDMRGYPYEDNAFTIKKLDKILEDL